MRGKELVAKILSRLPKRKREGVLEYIDQKDHPLAQALKEKMVCFDDIALLRSADISRLHTHLELGDVALALKNAPEAIEERLLCGISQHKKELILEERRLLGPVKVSAVDNARQKITSVLRELIEAGEISINEEWIE